MWCGIASTFLFVCGEVAEGGVERARVGLLLEAESGRGGELFIERMGSDPAKTLGFGESVDGDQILARDAIGSFWTYRKSVLPAHGIE